MSPEHIFLALGSFVRPVVKHYLTDYTTYDFNTIVGSQYSGALLLSYRDTGTHLFVFCHAHDMLTKTDALGRTPDGYVEKRTPADQINDLFSRKRYEVTHGNNSHFVYFDGSVFLEVTLQQALAIIDQRHSWALNEVHREKLCPDEQPGGTLVETA